MTLESGYNLHPADFALLYKSKLLELILPRLETVYRAQAYGQRHAPQAEVTQPWPTQAEQNERIRLWHERNSGPVVSAARFRARRCAYCGGSKFRPNAYGRGDECVGCGALRD